MPNAVRNIQLAAVNDTVCALTSSGQVLTSNKDKLFEAMKGIPTPVAKLVSTMNGVFLCCRDRTWWGWCNDGYLPTKRADLQGASDVFCSPWAYLALIDDCLMCWGRPIAGYGDDPCPVPHMKGHLTTHKLINVALGPRAWLFLLSDGKSTIIVGWGNFYNPETLVYDEIEPDQVLNSANVLDIMCYREDFIALKGDGTLMRIPNMGSNPYPVGTTFRPYGVNDTGIRWMQICYYGSIVLRRDGLQARAHDITVHPSPLDGYNLPPFAIGVHDELYAWLQCWVAAIHRHKDTPIAWLPRDLARTVGQWLWAPPHPLFPYTELYL